MEYTQDYDIAIIGAGPAGLTAALYAKRANMNVCFIDKGAPGGKVTTTAFVENYPGIDYISGPDLSLKWYEQVIKLGAKHIGGEVLDIVAPSDENYRYIVTNKNKVIRAKAVIIATGMINRLLNIPGEKEYEHRGISYCCICDGSIYKGKTVSIIGSGRSAVEESIYMSDIASKVHVISNKTAFKAEQGIVDAMNRRDNIEVHFGLDTLEFKGDGNHLTDVVVKDQKTGVISDIPVDGSFTFIGFLPMAPTVNQQSILDPDKRFIVVNSDMSTTIPGIFAAGDIVAKGVRQITTAVGDGATAALAAIDYVGKRPW